MTALHGNICYHSFYLFPTFVINTFHLYIPLFSLLKRPEQHFSRNCNVFMKRWLCDVVRHNIKAFWIKNPSTVLIIGLHYSSCIERVSEFVTERSTSMKDIWKSYMNAKFLKGPYILNTSVYRIHRHIQ